MNRETASQRHYRKFQEGIQPGESVYITFISVSPKQSNSRNHVEHVRKFTILPHEFTVADGELTPTLKIKRRVVKDHFVENIEAMYEE